MNHADTDVEEEEGRNNGTLVEWIACPVDGCGEWVQLLKIEEHIELHGTPGHSGTSTLAAAPASIQFNGPASESDYPVMAASRTHRRTGVNDLPAAPTPPPIRTQVNKVDLSNVKRLGVCFFQSSFFLSLGYLDILDSFLLLDGAELEDRKDGQ